MAALDEVEEQLGALDLDNRGVVQGNALEGLLGSGRLPHFELRLSQGKQQLGIAPRVWVAAQCLLDAQDGALGMATVKIEACHEDLVVDEPAHGYASILMRLLEVFRLGETIDEAVEFA